MFEWFVKRSVPYSIAAALTGGLLLAGAPARGESDSGLLLLVQNPPPHGLVVAHADLTAAARQNKAIPFVPAALRAEAHGKSLPVQFIPDPDFDDQKRIVGTLVLRWMGSDPGRVRLTLASRPSAKAAEETADWKGTVQTKSLTVTHDARRMGGLPSRTVFAATGKALENYLWNDRLYHREQGAFFLRHDPHPQVKQVSEGPLCTVVRVRARYLQAEGKQPSSEPEAIYDWYYFQGLPLVWVKATVRQRETFAWHEHHFLELNFPGAEFGRWAGGEALQQGEFAATQKVFGFPSWGALIDGRHAIAMVESGRVMVYDGGDHGRYLHAHGNMAWQEWNQKERSLSAWLWVGTETDPIAAVRDVLPQLPTKGKISISSPIAQAEAEGKP